jgi:hypothetical protein
VSEETVRLGREEDLEWAFGPGRLLIGFPVGPAAEDEADKDESPPAEDD